MYKNPRRKKRKTIKRKGKGGLKQKDPKLTSWQAVYKMIENPLSTLKKISYSSLKGFIFKLDVPPSPENSEFFGLNSSGTAFTIPIYSLIFKFAIISEREVASDTESEVESEEEELPRLVIPGEFRSYEKETEDFKSFETESQVQQNIYIETANPSGKPICLAVADFSYFNKTASDKLIEKLLIKCQSDEKACAMLNYLYVNVISSRKLGMITMELADSDFKELNEFSRGDSSIFGNLTNYALAQILILFTKLKIFNYDCHFGNVLGKLDGTKTFLIDFGRTLNFSIRDPFPEYGNIIIREYNKITGRNYANDLRETTEISVTDLYVSRRITQQAIIDKMEKIIKFMSYIDYITNTTYFDMRSLGMRPQMIGFLRYIYGSEFSSNWPENPPDWSLTPFAKDKFTSLIPVIIKLTESPSGAMSRLSSLTMKTMMNDGRLFSIKSGASYDRSDISSWSQASPLSEQIKFSRGGTKKRKLYRK